MVPEERKVVDATERLDDTGVDVPGLVNREDPGTEELPIVLCGITLELTETGTEAALSRDWRGLEAAEANEDVKCTETTEEGRRVIRLGTELCFGEAADEGTLLITP